MNPDILRRIESFEQEGERFRQQLATELSNARQGQGVGDAASIWLGKNVIPMGYKRPGKKLVQGFFADQRKTAESATYTKADQWIDNVVNFFNGISKVTSALSERGNSSMLTVKFNNARNASRPDTKIREALKVLKQLKCYDLVYNHEIKAYLTERKMARKKSRKFDHHTKEAKQLLKKYPAELEAFLGAIETLERSGLDKNRQAMSSCRNCLENLVKKLSQENDWGVGLVKIVQSETRQRTVKATYQYLSGYGTHGKEIPSDDDTISGMDQTLAVIRIVISGGK